MFNLGASELGVLLIVALSAILFPVAILAIVIALTRSMRSSAPRAFEALEEENRRLREEIERLKRIQNPAAH